MNLLKSYRNHSLLLIVSIGTTVLVFIGLIIYLMSIQFSMGIMEKNYNLFINRVNRVFLKLQDPEILDKEEFLGYLKSLEEIYNRDLSHSFLLIRKVAPETFPVQPADFSYGELNRFYGDLRSFTKELRERRFQQLQDGVSAVYTILGILLVLILLISVLIFLFYRRFHRFILSIDKGIKQIDSHLHYEKVSRLTVSEDDPLEVRDFYRTINKIDDDIELDQFLDGVDSYGRLSDVLEMIAPVIQGLIPCDRIALAFNDTKGYVTAESAYTNYRGIQLDPGKSEMICQTSLEHLVQRRESRIIPDLVDYARGNKVSESTKLILKEGIRSSITVPLFNGDRCIGFLFLSSKVAGIYKQNHLKTANRIANKLKTRFYNDFLIQEVIAETSRSFVSLVNEKDNETSSHLDRMTQYSFLIARCLTDCLEELTPQLIREIRWFAPLHDIGKVGVPDAILGKHGPLTDEEIRIMRQHVVLGEKIIQTMNGNLDAIVSKPLLQTAVDIIRGHHERFDGKGYPKGLIGEEIPLAGRIIAVADVFDALTSKRVYKDAYSIDESCRIMAEEMNGAFDPDVFQGLLDAMDEIRSVYEALKEV